MMYSCCRASEAFPTEMDKVVIVFKGMFGWESTL